MLFQVVINFAFSLTQMVLLVRKNALTWKIEKKKDDIKMFAVVVLMRYCM